MATTLGQAAQRITQLNPWWRTPRWADTDADLQEAADTGLTYQSGALNDLRSGGLYILRGPRRVGKTVALKQTIASLLAGGTPTQSIVRLAVDGWAAKELRTAIQNAPLPPVPEGSDRYWFIDEISAVVGDWAAQIKWLRDNDTDFRRATVVLTGSNATALTEAAGLLAGRRGDATDRDRTLWPIGFRTFVALTTRETPPTIERIDVGRLRSARARDSYRQLVPWLDPLVRAWETYLFYGGFPRAVAAAARGESIPPSFVDDIFNVIAGDAFRHSKLSVPQKMDLLERLWRSVSTPANLSKIGSHVGVTNEVVARHVGYLRDSYLLWSCPQREPEAWRSRARAHDKLYAIDPLVARLPYLRSSSRHDIDVTALAEMQIGMALRRAIARSDPAASNDQFLFHVRTPARKEIDFTAHHLRNVAVEGKYTEAGGWRSEAATVNASAFDGLLATRNVLDVNGDDAWAVPAAFLAYLVDT